MARGGISGTVVLLWLSGIALRETILAVPPVIPYLRSDLLMSATEIGILSGLPMLMIAAAAIPGSLAISRFGALQTLVGGLILSAFGAALRGDAASVAALLASTTIMSVGIAIAQPALPVLVREWLPSQIGFGTAAYSNGMVAGCLIPMILTPPLLPALGNNWRLVLAGSSLPVLAIVGVLVPLAPRPAKEKPVHAALQPRWSALDYGLLWRIGLIFGSNNSIYFGTNAFLPLYLSDVGRPDLIASALLVYNFAQLPSSLLIMALAHRIERRIWPYVAAGLLAIASIAVICLTGSIWTVIATGTLGLASGITLALGLALPPLLSASSDVGRVSAVMFMISYTFAMLVALLSGFASDLIGNATAAFVLIALSALPVVLLTPTLQFHRQ